ncbi:hypothetical protein EON81_17845 [bacterium]|nr:MAG: hypothetical protein EON81_17845 [bacterium]
MTNVPRSLSPVPKWFGPDQWERMLPKERALQTMAYLADVVKVRESGGNNRGPEVREFLRSAGLGEGYPWCAAAICFARKSAGLPVPKGAAAVRNWASFLPSTSSPTRGDLCYWLNADGSGHIGIVVRTLGLWTYSIEGNTSGGETGSQRDGDGMFRRVRLRGSWRYLRG